MIIALTGEKISGKTTVAHHLVREYQAEYFRFSQILMDVLERLHQPVSRKNLVAVGTQLRTLFGDDFLATVLSQDIRRSTGRIKVVDGMRYVAEYEVMKQELGGIYLIDITADLHTRYERMAGREEKADEKAMSWEEFQKRENDVTEEGIVDLRKKADLQIINDGSVEELFTKIDMFIQERL